MAASRRERRAFQRVTAVIERPRMGEQALGRAGARSCWRYRWTWLLPLSIAPRYIRQQQQKPRRCSALQSRSPAPEAVTAAACDSSERAVAVVMETSRKRPPRTSSDHCCCFRRSRSSASPPVSLQPHRRRGEEATRRCGSTLASLGAAPRVKNESDYGEARPSRRKSKYHLRLLRS